MVKPHVEEKAKTKKWEKFRNNLENSRKFATVENMHTKSDLCQHVHNVGVLAYKKTLTYADVFLKRSKSYS